MAKLAFWITAGPESEGKALAGMILASRLKKLRQQEVEVYFFGPAVGMVGSPGDKLKEALDALKDADVRGGFCPANAQQFGVETVLTANGLHGEPAGEAIVRLAEEGYQIVGY